MATRRSNQIDLSATPYYHCVTRCVRQAFLCGFDKASKKNFDHRKQWLVDLFEFLTQYFVIDICAYSVMSNHYHLVLKVDGFKANKLSDREVVERWGTMFKHSKAAEWIEEKRDDEYLKLNKSLIKMYRARLFDISWFMRALNERIARRANKEDNRKGRFWEARFKSQALLDEAALLACMVYVDLNPIRAGLCKTPEKSDFTSVQKRIQSFKKQTKQPKNLAKLSTDYSISREQENRLPIDIQSYFELVDTTGRVMRTDKKGYIPDNIIPILDRLRIDSDHWMDTVMKFEENFKTFVGTADSMMHFSRNKRHKVHGISKAMQAFH